jgi:hypothetical protein
MRVYYTLFSEGYILIINQTNTRYSHRKLACLEPRGLKHAILYHVASSDDLLQQEQDNYSPKADVALTGILNSRSQTRQLQTQEY